TKAKKVSTQVIPDFLVKILARFDKSLAMPATFLGQNTACSNEKSVKLLSNRAKILTKKSGIT
ncbi:hypothetical protein ACI3PF_22285, partial [Lactococcus lactis]